MAGILPAEEARPQPSQDEQLYGLIARDWEYLKQHAPAVAQFAGDWQWMNSWPDVSSASLGAMDKHDRRSLEELRRIDRRRLSDSAVLDFGLFERELLFRQKEYAARAYLTSFWQFDRFGPTPLRLLSFVASEPPPTEPQHFAARLQRLKAFPKYVDQQIDRMREAGRRKMLPPAILVTATIKSLESELNGAPEKSAFYRSFAAAGAIAGAPAQLPAAREVIVATVKPAIRRLLTFLSDEHLKLCPADVSLSKWPHGSSWYRLLVSLSTSTRSSPEDLHRTGIAEVARIRAQLEGAIRATGYRGPVEDFLASLRGGDRFSFATEEELAQGYRSAAERASAQVAGLFRFVPPVPKIAARQFGPSGPGASYGRNATVLVNVSNPEIRPKFEMMALMLHEGTPGHHLQKSIEAAESAGRRTSAALQRLRRSDAFVEGWALYAETLGYDAGLYADPYDRFGQLTYELMRAVRMVVDTGIHSRGWSREEAVRYFREITGKSSAVAEGEIDRAIWDPASMVAYKAGELTLSAMRREAKQRLGASFDIRDFHDFVLRTGPLPLDVLDVQFRKWLTGGRGIMPHLCSPRCSPR